MGSRRKAAKKEAEGPEPRNLRLGIDSPSSTRQSCLHLPLLAAATSGCTCRRSASRLLMESTHFPLRSSSPSPSHHIIGASYPSKTGDRKQPTIPAIHIPPSSTHHASSLADVDSLLLNFCTHIIGNTFKPVDDDRHGRRGRLTDHQFAPRPSSFFALISKFRPPSSLS